MHLLHGVRNSNFVPGTFIPATFDLNWFSLTYGQIII